MLFTIIRSIAEPFTELNYDVRGAVRDTLSEAGCDECVADAIGAVVAPGKIAKGVTDVCDLARWITNNS